MQFRRVLCWSLNVISAAELAKRKGTYHTLATSRKIQSAICFQHLADSRYRILLNDYPRLKYLLLAIMGGGILFVVAVVSLWLFVEGALLGSSSISSPEKPKLKDIFDRYTRLLVEET